MTKHPSGIEMTDNINYFVGQFDQFNEQGIIAHNQVFEIVEILGYIKGGITFNVLTIVIASETLVRAEPLYLKVPIRVDGIKGFQFEVCRSVVPTAKVREAVEEWMTSGIWRPFGESICVGELDPLAGRFVPANWENRIALNRVIKNNFFNGSHILELFDSSKKHVQALFSEPETLASLSGMVGEVLPIEIASIADRLGNIILQFPVEVIRAKFSTNGSSHSVEVAWHPKSEPRGLLAVGSVYHDQTPVAFGCASLSSGKAEICADAAAGLFRGYIWDVENKILLAATDDGTYIKRMQMEIQSMGSEPRTFPKTVGKDPDQVQVRFHVHPPIPTQIEDFSAEKIIEPIQSRIYDDERRTLAQRRTFVQYGAPGETKKEGRERALEDLRWLITQHGDLGVWLWDPYLDPQSVLDSLFRNKNAGSQMRALARVKCDKRGDYIREFETLNSNFLGLDIEFRSAHGRNGWHFHDRFLIFPKSGATGPKAWSLGASVNGLGIQHHILQQVDNAQLVASAFEKLWDSVSGPENLIWKYP